MDINYNDQQPSTIGVLCKEMLEMNTTDLFRLNDRTVIITGGGGLMADSHARAVISGGISIRNPSNHSTRKK